jgi:alpha-L-fucosidase
MHLRLRKSIAAAAVLAALATVHCAAAADQDRDSRLAWWREAKFGMFIHWGLYSLPAGEWKGRTYPGIGEWIMFKARIPLADYEQLARQFNPVKFDAEAWAQLAQDAGMKYLVITSKHHDGFAMFGSKADAFNIVDATPFRRDPMKELAAACAKRGIKFGFYYSQAQDWHAPGGAIWEGPHEAEPARAKAQWDPRQQGDFATYFNGKAIPQVREILTNYGPIAIVWFDTPLNVMSVERAGQLEKVVHQLQPGTLISGRLGGQSQSDYESEGDNAIPHLARAGAWETPATLNDTWGFKKNDHNWKKADDLAYHLVDIVSKGGNYLLNVGPDGEGVIPQPSQQMLRLLGQWLKVNGESVYGAGRSPFGEEFGAFSKTRLDGQGKPVFEPRKVWRCTTKPGKLYIHMFQWPAGNLALPPVKSKVLKATLLAAPERRVGVKQSGSGVVLSFTGEAGDPLASVVRLDLSAPLHLTNP